MKEIVQTTFTMDEQCRMEFGEGYMYIMKYLILKIISSALYYIFFYLILSTIAGLQLPVVQKF